MTRIANFFSLVRRFAFSHRGNITILAAVMLPVAMTVTGAAVDYSRVLRAKNHIANLADQAALAAVSVDQQDRVAVARRFIDANMSEQFKNFVRIMETNISAPPVDAVGMIQANVGITAEIDTLFGGTFGLATIRFAHVGQASRDLRNYEISMALASSGTMCATKSRYQKNAGDIEGDTLLKLEPDPKCKHFNAMKSGVNTFIDTMEKNSAAKNVAIGLVPYNYKVRMPYLYNIPPSMTGLEDRGFYNQVQDATPLSEVVSLTTNMQTLRTAIKNLEQSPQGVAWGRTNVGAHVASLMLDPSSASYFKHERKPVEFGSPGTDKAMILITDGTNLGCCFTNHPDDQFRNQYIYFYEPDNKQQVEICTALKDTGTKIFTILLDVDPRDPGGKVINNIFAECASGAYNDPDKSYKSGNLLCKEKQNCYDVKSDDDMIRAFADIAQSFYRPKLTK